MGIKHWTLMGMICVVALTALVAARLLASGVWRSSAPWLNAARASTPIHPTDAEILEQLRKETLSDSLANLWIGREFVFPASFLTSNMFVFFPRRQVGGETERDDWIEILSNRRVVKLLEELDELPKEEAGRMLSEQIRQNLERCRQLRAEREAARAEREAARGVEQPKSVTGNTGRPVHPMNTVPQKPGDDPNLDFMRDSVMALVFIAGAVGLPSASDAVREVTRLALAQRDRCYGLEPQTHEQYVAFHDMTVGGYYNPSVLATAIRGTRMADKGALDAIAPPETYWTEEDLTDWKSPHMTYEMGWVEPDFSLGRVRVGYYVNLTDEQFDRICRAARIR